MINLLLINKLTNKNGYPKTISFEGLEANQTEVPSNINNLSHIQPKTDEQNDDPNFSISNISNHEEQTNSHPNLENPFLPTLSPAKILPSESNQSFNKPPSSSQMRSPPKPDSPKPEVTVDVPPSADLASTPVENPPISEVY